MPWQGPLTERATAYRQRQLYRPLSTYALTPQNIFNWGKKLLFYRRKAKRIAQQMTDLMRDSRFPMRNKRERIDKLRSSVQYYDRIVAHYVRLLSGVATDPPGITVGRQAADLGRHIQFSNRYLRSDHRIHNMLRTGNFTEGLDQVPYDILEEYMGRMRHERVLGRPWRPPVSKKRKRDEF